jgi:hypothetical protein
MAAAKLWEAGALRLRKSKEVLIFGIEERNQYLVAECGKGSCWCGPNPVGVLKRPPGNLLNTAAKRAFFVG